MKRIGFVVPWYGDNIPGGAEMEAREIANHLYEAGITVEILTTCVKEFASDWSNNYYKSGEYYSENGILIKRFEVRKRNTTTFDSVNAKLMQGQDITLEEEDLFLREMINSPELYRYIREHKEEYEVFLFIPYMFGTTYFGMQECLEKAVLIPCFHDEPYAYFQRFREVFSQVSGMIFNSKPERELADKIYGIDTINTIIMGIGMDTTVSGNADMFREKYKIDKPFILYAGRKDEGKNIYTLLKYFEEYKKTVQNNLQLVLIGGGKINIPESIKQNVHDLGFIDMQDKYDAYTAALLLCQPSKNESFSLVIMESWLCHSPVLVHEDCAVTKNFVIEANGGLYFKNYLDFEGCVNYFLTHKQQAELMGENGRQYVLQCFAWDVITKKYIEFFKELTEVSEDEKNCFGESTIWP